MAPEAAREELERCAGSQFDPAVVEAFLAALEDVPELTGGGDLSPPRGRVT